MKAKMLHGNKGVYSVKISRDDGMEGRPCRRGENAPGRDNGEMGMTGR